MTTQQDIPSTAPPQGDRFIAARWLVDRHPVLLGLLSRIPGFIDDYGNPDVDLLAQTITEYEQYVFAWTVYERRCPPPRDEERFERWQDAGPRGSVAVSCIGCMLPSERARLRMLATFSIDRVPVSVADFTSMDASGRALLTDWTLAVRAS